MSVNPAPALRHRQSSTPDPASEAQQAARLADAAAARAQKAYEDAERQLSLDQENGVDPDTLREDKNVVNAAETANLAAKQADMQATRDAADAAAEQASDPSLATFDADLALQAASKASGYADEAERADDNENDAYGDPGSNLGQAEAAADAALNALNDAAYNLVEAEKAFAKDPTELNKDALANARSAYEEATTTYMDATAEFNKLDNSSSGDNKPPTQ